MRVVSLVTGILLSLVAFVGYLAYSQSQSDWPKDFPVTQGGQPSIIAKLDPDFSHRIGDPIPMTVFIKEMPGTQIDFDSVALEGNYEIRGALSRSELLLEDGSRLIRLELSLQSFSVKKKLSANLSLAWSPKDKRDWQELRHPLQTAYTSRTWDGREEIQEGKLAFLHGPHVIVCGALLLGGLLGFVWSICYQLFHEKWRKDHKAAEQASPRMICKAQVEAAWERISAGDLSPGHFRQIEVAVRNYLGLQAVQNNQFRAVLGLNFAYHGQLNSILELTGRVIYKRENLQPEQLKQLKADLDVLINGRPAAHRY